MRTPRGGEMAAPGGGQGAVGRVFHPVEFDSNGSSRLDTPRAMPGSELRDSQIPVDGEPTR
jgi:hypothetical protein